jgi:hypothetical protein
MRTPPARRGASRADQGSQDTVANTVQHRAVDLTVPTPDLIEPVIGYRQWRLHDGALWSPYFEMRWRRGVNTAHCAAPGSHPEGAPAHACSCGLHAWYRPCPRLGSAAASDLVAGAIVVWGAVELHPTGLRAQHAMVVALALPLASRAKRRRVCEVASALEVAAVPARRLAAAARACVRPVARTLVPPRRAR